MNLLLIDQQGAALDLALKAMAAGHQVRVYMAKNDEREYPTIGDDIVTKVTDWQASMTWADLIVLSDNTKVLRDLEVFRKRGFPIFGPSYAGGQLELDRARGQEFLNECGIETIPYEVFSSYDKAEAYVRAGMKRYVSKPSGDADKALSYVAKSPADMIYMLQRWKDNNKLKGDFILQEFKEGTELAVGGWLGPEGFLPMFFENFEHKKLMNDDLGPNVGEMGTIGKYTTQSELADKLLLPCESALVTLGVRGYVDINTIVDKDGTPWPMEFTVRPGWPTMHLQMAVHEGDPVQWMLDLVMGADTLKVSEEVVTGIVLAIPDFPYSMLTKKELTGYPVYGTESIDKVDLHWGEVMLGKAPRMADDAVVEEEMYVTAGDYVLVATGRSSEVQQSVDAAYDNIGRVEMPNSAFYRTDLGRRVLEQLPELKKLNLCASWPDG